MTMGTICQSSLLRTTFSSASVQVISSMFSSLLVTLTSSSKRSEPNLSDAMMAAVSRNVDGTKQKKPQGYHCDVNFYKYTSTAPRLIRSFCSKNTMPSANAFPLESIREKISRVKQRRWLLSTSVHVGFAWVLHVWQCMGCPEESTGVCSTAKRWALWSGGWRRCLYPAVEVEVYDHCRSRMYMSLCLYSSSKELIRLVLPTTLQDE